MSPRDLIASWWRCPACDSGIRELPNRPFSQPPVCKYCTMAWLQKRPTGYEQLADQIEQLTGDSPIRHISNLIVGCLPENWQLESSWDDSYFIELTDADFAPVQIDVSGSDFIEDLQCALRVALAQKLADVVEGEKKHDHRNDE